MIRRGLVLTVLTVAVGLFAWLASPFDAAWVRTASAHMGHERPQIGGPPRAKAPAPGPHGRVRIKGDGGEARVRLTRQSDGSFAGGFQVANVGDGPLKIYRVGVLLSDDGEALVPAGVAVQIVPGSSPLVAPGEARPYTVSWRPAANGPRELEGYLTVDTDAAAPNATEWDQTSVVAISAAARPLPLQRALTVAWLAPLLVSLLAAFAFRRAAGGDRMLHRAASAVAGVVAVVSAFPLATISRELGRDAGNDGLSFIERSRLFGPVEYFLAVDGVSAALLAASGVALFAIVLASPASRPGFRNTLLAAGVIASSTALVVVAQSLALVTLGYVVVAVVVAMLAARASTRRSHVEAVRSGRAAMFAGLLGSVALAVFTSQLGQASGGGLLADGSDTKVSLAIPEIARAAAHGHALHADATHHLLGLPLDRGLAVLAIIAAFALAPGMPLSSWLGKLVAEHEPSIGALVTAFTSIVSVAVLLRVTIALVPTGARWASSTVMVVAAVTAVFAAASAIRYGELGRVAGDLVVATGALSMLAAFSLTPQGLTGAVAFSIGRSLAGPALILVVGAIVLRTGTSQLAELGGLGRSAPRLAALLGVAVLSSAAIPGGASFWGAFLSMFGWVGRSPHLALVGALAFGATAVAHARLARVVVGEPPADLSAQAALEPHGGRVPDLFRSEHAWVAVVVVGLVLLTLAPRLVLGATSPAVLDLFRALDPAGPTQVS